MVKAKVKSREQELQEQWIKYFKNIEKENDLIRLILKYCKEIEPKIKEMFIKSSNNIEEDEGPSNIATGFVQGLYGGFTHDLMVKDNGQIMYFIVSQWNKEHYLSELFEVKFKGGN